MAHSEDMLHRRLRLPLVELTPAGTGNVWKETIERGTPGLIQIAPEGKVVPQEPAALRDAKAERVIDPCRCRVSGRDVTVAQERDAVAHRQEPGPDDRRP